MWSDNLPLQLRRRFGDTTPEQGASCQGLGSGFIISTDGQIVTNHHVVAGAETVTVKLADGRSFDAEVLGGDPLTDIAVLKLTADVPLPTVAFGTSGDLRVVDLTDDDVIARGWLGVRTRPMTEEVTAVLGYDAPKGALVEAISTDSFASAAGLKRHKPTDPRPGARGPEIPKARCAQ